MKLLITGATGFIGQHLVRRLLERGDTVSILVRATAQTENVPKEVSIITIPPTQTELEGIFKKEKFDGVIHLASLYLMSHAPTDIKALIDSNVKLGTLVIDAAANANIGFFINTGSFAQHYNSLPYSPTNLYSATKQAFQDIVQYYAEATDLTVLTLELFNTFGPGDTRAKIFNLWMNVIKEGKTLDMSPGEQIIDISYIDDVIDAYLLAIDHATSTDARSLTGRSYTIMSPERMPLKELSRVFSEEVGSELKINFGAMPYREHETMIPMENGEILPGWSPKVTLREGIRRTFLSN